MIKEVDVDGDGRIDFYGKISSALYIATVSRGWEPSKKDISISISATIHP